MWWFFIIPTNITWYSNPYQFPPVQDAASCCTMKSKIDIWAGISLLNTQLLSLKRITHVAPADGLTGRTEQNESKG